MIEDVENLENQKEEFESHLLVQEYLRLADIWQERYCRLIRYFIAEFGEEEVLDTVEQVWFEQGYEVGLAWREKFDKDPVAALREKASSWHDDPLWARICCCDVPVLEDDRWELHSLKCYREYFNRVCEQKIGICWCIPDFAAVRAWSPNLVMRQPKHHLRGDNFCQQIRYFTDNLDEQWDYSREFSEKVGWRSVKALEAKGGS